MAGSRGTEGRHAGHQLGCIAVGGNTLVYIPVCGIYRRIAEREKHHSLALVEQRTERVCRRVMAGISRLPVVRHRHIEQQD